MIQCCATANKTPALASSHSLRCCSASIASIEECLLLFAIKLDLPLSILPAALLATKPFVFAFKTGTIHVHHCQKDLSFSHLWSPLVPFLATGQDSPLLNPPFWKENEEPHPEAPQRHLDKQSPAQQEAKGRDPFRCYWCCAYLGFPYTFDENHQSIHLDFHWQIWRPIHFHSIHATTLCIRTLISDWLAYLNAWRCLSFWTRWIFNRCVAWRAWRITVLDSIHQQASKPIPAHHSPLATFSHTRRGGSPLTYRRERK